MLKLKKVIATVLCLLMVFSTYTAYANESEIKVIQNDFADDNIVGNYLEGENLIIITSTSPELPPSFGQCPSSYKTVTMSVTKRQLVQWREENRLEYTIKNILAGDIAGVFRTTIGIVLSALSVYTPSLVRQLESVIDNAAVGMDDTIEIRATFRCYDKVQAGNWYHLWILKSVGI